MAHGTPTLTTKGLPFSLDNVTTTFNFPKGIKEDMPLFVPKHEGI